MSDSTWLADQKYNDEIDEMLHDGAKRRGVSVERYREIVIEDVHGAAAKRRSTLRVQTRKEWRNFLVTYQKLEDEAVSTGGSVAQLVEAYFRVMIDKEEPENKAH